MNNEEANEYRKNLYSKNPLKGKKVRERAARELADMARRSDPTAIILLADAIIEHPDPTVKAQAEQTLAQLKSPAAINTFCSHWAVTRDEGLEKILLEAGYTAWEPLELRILTALKIGKVRNITGMGPEIVPPLIKYAKDPDQAISRRAVKALGFLKDESAVDAFCRSWQETRDPILEEILLQARYVARHPRELRVLTSLKTGEILRLTETDKEIVHPLIEALEHKEKEIANRARVALSQLTDREAIDVFCATWAKTRDPVLEDIMVNAGHIAGSPPAVAILTALKQGESVETAGSGEKIVEALIDALQDDDKEIKGAAEKALRQLKDEAAVDAFCVLWEKTRDTRMERIMLESGYTASKPPFVHVLTAFKTGKLEKIMQVDPVFRQAIKDYFESDKWSNKILSAVENIKETLVAPIIKICRDKEKEISVQARKVLVQLENPEAIDFFCFCWAITKNPVMENLISLAGYVADPGLPTLHVMTALKAGKTKDLVNGGPDMVNLLVKILEDRDKELSSRAEEALKQLKNPEAVATFCDLLLIHQSPLLLKIAGEANFAPCDDSQRALFLFITEQWDEYEKFDPQRGRPHLRSGFRRAAVAVKKAVLKVAKKNGKDHILDDALIGEGYHLKVGELRDSQWEIILESLKMHQKWDEMKKLIFWAPLKWSAAMAAELREKWRSPGGGEGEYGDLEDLETVFQAIPEGEADFDLPDVYNPLTLREHKWNVDSLAVSPDGKMFVSGGMVEETIRLWEIPEARLKGTLGEKGKNTLTAAFSPDGRLLAAGGSAKEIGLWKFPEAEYIRPLEGHKNSVTCLAVSPDGAVLASGSLDKTIRLWSLPGGSLITTLRQHTDEIGALAFASDSFTLISGSRDKTICIWDLQKGKAVHTLEGHENSVSTLGTAVDGSLFWSGSLDNTLRLWELPGGKLIKILKGHKNWVMDTAITPDGKFLISGSMDKTIRFWSLPGGGLTRTLEVPGDGVTCLAAVPGPGGRFVLSGGMDKSIRWWVLDWITPMAFATPEDLTSGEKSLHRRKQNLAAGWLFWEAILKAKRDPGLQFEEKSIFTGDFTLEIDD